jgi:hypothetical protein
LAGYGTGEWCYLCEKSIAPHQIEYEIELNEPGGTRALHFHLHLP